MEITKSMWTAWKKEEKRKTKAGETFIFCKNTKTWVKVWWRS